MRASDARQSALEIGPGDGRFLLEMAQGFTHVWGLDSAAGMLARAEKTVADSQSVTLVNGEWPAAAAQLPQMDAIVLNMV